MQMEYYSHQKILLPGSCRMVVARLSGLPPSGSEFGLTPMAQSRPVDEHYDRSLLDYRAQFKRVDDGLCSGGRSIDTSCGF